MEIPIDITQILRRNETYKNNTLIKISETHMKKSIGDYGEKKKLNLVSK